jgi:hypothetical protein
MMKKCLNPRALLLPGLLLSAAPAFALMQEQKLGPQEESLFFQRMKMDRDRAFPKEQNKDQDHKKEVSDKKARLLNDRAQGVKNASAFNEAGVKIMADDGVARAEPVPVEWAPTDSLSAVLLSMLVLGVGLFAWVAYKCKESYALRKAAKKKIGKSEMGLESILSSLEKRVK